MQPPRRRQAKGIRAVVYLTRGLSPSQSVRRMLSLPPTPWQVFGADLNCSESEGVRLGCRRQMARARWKAGNALAAGKMTGTNREVEAVVAASFTARTA